MGRSHEQSAVEILSGRARGLVPTIVRGTTRLIEPLYATAMRLRNVAYDSGVLKVHRLPRPAVSVGNLTTGGTGKTPVIRWLAEKLIERGKRPAILMRGYRGDSIGGSDEQRMLAEYLGSNAIVIANPDRVAGAAAATRETHPPDVFLLDDAFQHRRVARDFDLVLINAAEPFGFGHVLPRGLLREPIAGIRRSSAIVVTHSDQVQSRELDRLESWFKRFSAAPVYCASHQVVRFSTEHGQAMPIDALADRRHYLFCGIGSPNNFANQFAACASKNVGTRIFDDHHAYTPSDVESLRQAATAAGAEVLVTTAKDWMKLRTLPNSSGGLPIWRAELEIRFDEDHEGRLLNQILEATSQRAG